MRYSVFRMPTNEDAVTRQYLPYHTHPAQRAKISMVATPIGNLTDMSPRAIQTLGECQELWCEDTRHTQNLLNALGLERRAHGKVLRRVDQHISDRELEGLMERVQQEGLHVAVVTDAGTPGVSDPGAKVIDKIVDFPGIRLEPIPGCSAVSAFLSIAGFEENSFTFQGFFPRQEQDALELLEEFKAGSGSRNWIFFESPLRIRGCLETLKKWASGLEFTPKFVLAKEISKLFETVWIGRGSEFLDGLLQQQFDERGEWVLAVILPKDYLKIKKPEVDWAVTLECLISAGISTKDASQLISQRFSIAKNLAYKEAVELQKKIKKNDSEA